MNTKPSASKLASNVASVESKRASVESTSSSGEPASDVASGESVAFSRRSRTRHPWNRSGHPERIASLIRGSEPLTRELRPVSRRSGFRPVARGFEPVIHGFGARTRRLQRPRPASWLRTCRPWTPTCRPPKRLPARCPRASDTHSRRSRIRNPWNRGARSRSQSAQPASRSRARRRGDQAPPPEGVGSVGHRSEVLAQQAGLGPLVRGAAPDPASRVRGRFPESEPMPAEAVKGSSSDEREPLVRGIRAYACRSRPRLVFRWIRASFIRANRSLPMDTGAAAGKPVAAPARVATGLSASKLASRQSAAVVPTSSRGSPCEQVRWQHAAPQRRDSRPASWRPFLPPWTVGVCPRRSRCVGPRCPPPPPEGADGVGEYAGGALASGLSASKLASFPSAVDCQRLPPKEPMRRSAVPTAVSRRSRWCRLQDRSGSRHNALTLSRQADFESTLRSEHSVSPREGRCRFPSPGRPPRRASIRVSKDTLLSRRARCRRPPKRSRARHPCRACVPDSRSEPSSAEAKSNPSPVSSLCTIELGAVVRRSGIELVTRGRASICFELRASPPPKRNRARSSETSLSSPPEPDSGTGKPVTESASAERSTQSEDIAVRSGQIRRSHPEGSHRLPHRRGSKAAPPGRCVSARARTEPAGVLHPTDRPKPS
jgi:hypothetical protein